MDERKVSEHYRELAQQLIENEPLLSYIAESDVSVVYLISQKERKSQGRTVYAECEKIPQKYSWAIPYDFSVTVFAPNVERMNDKQVQILLLHELLHVGIERDGNEETYRIIPHDVEDFRVILDRYGLDWAQ